MQLKQLYSTEDIEEYQEEKVMSIDKHINYQTTFKKMYKWGPHSVTLSNNKSHKNLDLEWKNGPEKEIKSGNGVVTMKNRDKPDA